MENRLAHLSIWPTVGANLYELANRRWLYDSFVRYARSRGAAFLHPVASSRPETSMGYFYFQTKHGEMRAWFDVDVVEGQTDYVAVSLCCNFTNPKKAKRLIGHGNPFGYWNHRFSIDEDAYSVLKKIEKLLDGILIVTK